jgi:predicted GNAT family N-acyltransferase
MGVASALIKRFFRDASKSGITHVTVNSSPYAVGFYHKIGFTDVREEIEKDGIRFTPMSIEL